MMTRAIFSGAVALLCAGAMASAQAPQGSQQRPGQPTQTEPRATAADQQRVTTLSGCLYREQQIPGRSPNVAERAGILEDYILADATMAGEASRTSSAGQPGQTEPRPGAAQPGAAGQQAGQAGSRPTAGLATGRMYKVTNIDDEKLRAMVGKRVEVTGRLEDVDRAGAAAQARDIDDLPEIEATSIREVAGTCPSTPAGASSPTSPSTPSRPTTPSTPTPNPANPPTPPNR